MYYLFRDINISLVINDDQQNLVIFSIFFSSILLDFYE